MRAGTARACIPSCKRVAHEEPPLSDQPRLFVKSLLCCASAARCVRALRNPSLELAGSLDEISCTEHEVPRFISCEYQRSATGERRSIEAPKRPEPLTVRQGSTYVCLRSPTVSAIFRLPSPPPASLQEDADVRAPSLSVCYAERRHAAYRCSIDGHRCTALPPDPRRRDGRCPCSSGE